MNTNNQQILEELQEKEKNNFKWLIISLAGLAGSLPLSTFIGHWSGWVYDGVTKNNWKIFDSGGGKSTEWMVYGLLIGATIATIFIVPSLIFFVKWLKSSNEREREREREQTGRVLV